MEPVYIQVPGNWLAAMGQDNRGYGTYRLRLRLPADRHQSYGLRLLNFESASTLFVNGRQVFQSGRPATSAGDYVPSPLPYTAFFTVSSDDVEILIHGSSYHSIFRPGLAGPVLLGSEDAVGHSQWLSSGLQLSMAIILVMHVIYVLILYFTRAGGRELLYVALLGLSGALQALVVDDKLLLKWTGASYEWGVKLAVLALGGSALAVFFGSKLCRARPVPAAKKLNTPYPRVAHNYHDIDTFPVCLVLVLPDSPTIYRRFPFCTLAFSAFCAPGGRGEHLSASSNRSSNFKRNLGDCQ